MTPKQRALAALNHSAPDDIVPTFELEFQLAEELLGRDFRPVWGVGPDELDANVAYNADLHVEIAERLDYSIIRTGHTPTLRRLVEIGAADRFLLCGEADGTMAIPDGDTMSDLVEEIYERPDDLHARLAKATDDAVESGARQIEAGAELLTMCADYCFNQGPFLSPPQFAEFVTPYLHRTIEAHHRNGAFVVKHTDGDLMPILDQIVDCEPDGLHSLDPQGGVDIAEIKRRYGDRLCLCGNVNCGLLQTGTMEEIRESALYSLRHGMPGGGFVFCTSNVAFKGLPLERYLFILELRREFGRYDGGGPNVPD